MGSLNPDLLDHLRSQGHRFGVITQRLLTAFDRRRQMHLTGSSTSTGTLLGKTAVVQLNFHPSLEPLTDCRLSDGAFGPTAYRLSDFCIGPAEAVVEPPSPRHVLFAETVPTFDRSTTPAFLGILTPGSQEEGSAVSG